MEGERAGGVRLHRLDELGRLTTTAISGWAALPDLLLAREALHLRGRRGVPADALIGIRVDDLEIDALLDEFATGATGDGAPATTHAATTFDERIAEARDGFEEALAAHPVLYGLARSIGLSIGEAELLALLCAIDLEPRRQRLLAYVQDDAAAVRVRLHTIARLFGGDHPALDALAPDGALVRTHLVTLGRGRPWGTTEVELAPVVAWAALGRLAIDPEVPPGWRVVSTGAPAGGEGRADELALVFGRDRIRRLEEVCRLLPRSLALVGQLPDDDRGWSAVVRTATVCGFAVVVECEGRLTAAERRWVEEADHLPWGISSTHPLPFEEIPRRPHVEHPGRAAVVTDEEYVELIGAPPPPGHRITAEQLQGLARRATNTDPAVGLNRLAAGSLEVMARRITPTRTFDDLVVDDDVRTQLDELIGRYRHRARLVEEWGVRPPTPGVTALFAGPSGTGKTLSAEIVAGALGLEMFKVDLSSVVSKWIGETEKNLEQIFAIAETTQQVLLFDEADALFGRRSDVSDARDRYANIEVAYLLQRLETYDGFVVLTTNLRQNLDDAFTRRMAAVIHFGVPGPKERQAIWDVALSGAALGDDVDTANLAEDVELTGGLIAAAALTAMHAAMAEGSSVMSRHLRHGLRRELQKVGRLVPPSLEIAP